MASAPSLSPNSAMLAALASEPKNMQTPYKCKEGLDSDECQAAFIQKEKFRYIYVAADGNCLFRALSEFYKLTDMPVPGFQGQKDWRRLRPFLIDEVERLMKNYSNTLETMIVTNFIDQTERRKEQLLSRMAVYQQQLADYPAAQEKYEQELATYLMMKGEGINMNEPEKPKSPKSPEKLPSIKKKTVDQLFSELRGKGSWDVAMIELLISRLPAILGVNISIHKVEHDSTRHNSYKVTNYFYRPVGYNPGHTINLMLNGAHYGLLVPLPKNQVFNNEKVNNSMGKRPSASQKSRKASNENAELQAALKESRNMSIAAIKQQIANLKSGVHNVSVRRKPSAAVKPSTASRKNHNSLNNNFSRLSIGNQPRVNARAEKKKKFPIGMTVIDESKDSSKISLKKSLQYFNEIFPGRLTFKSGAKKEDLYELFITAKIMEEQLLGNK